MKKIVKAAIALLAAATLLSSCATTNGAGGKKGAFDQAAYDSAFASGDYAACLSMLESAKFAKKDAILKQLDVNMLKYLNASYKDSAKAFMDTQSAMSKVTKDMSAGKVFAAALAGENSTTYAGPVYERILAYSMRAVNALSLGDVSNAKGIMDTYTGDYKDVIEAIVRQQKELEKQSEEGMNGEKVTKALDVFKKLGIGVDFDAMNKKTPSKSQKSYETSAFLSYLGTLTYAANGDSDHAKDFASALKTSNPNVDVSEDVSVPAGKGRINLVALSGTIGKRSEAAERFELGNIHIDGISKKGVSIEDTDTPITFKLTYPVFGPQNHAITGVRVTLSDGSAKTATLIEDFDEAVKADVEQKAPGTYARSISRNITKYAAAMGLFITAKAAKDKNSNKVTEALYITAAAALPIALPAIVEAESADVRQGAYFPHMASAAGFTVAPGTYSAKVEYLSGSYVLETKEVSGIVVEAGKPTVVMSSCAK